MLCMIHCRQWFQKISEFLYSTNVSLRFCCTLFSYFYLICLAASRIIIRNLSQLQQLSSRKGTFWIKLPFRLVAMKPLSIWDSLVRCYIRGCNRVIPLLPDIWQSLSHRDSSQRYSQDHFVTEIPSTFQVDFSKWEITSDFTYNRISSSRKINFLVEIKKHT